MQGMFNDVLGQAKQGYADNDFGWVYIQHRNLFAPIVVPPRKLNHLNAGVIMDEIEHVLHSEENLSVDDSLEVHVGMIHIPQVGKWSKITDIKGDNNSLLRKRSVVTINNKDNMCLARALTVVMAKLDEDPEYDKVRRGDRYKLQTERALALHRQTGVPHDQPCSLNDIQL